MRGFRGSRNAQNQMTSRFGRQEGYARFREGRGSESSPDQPRNGSEPGRSSLPDWLKTPETKALEGQARDHSRPKPQARANLALVPPPAAARAPAEAPARKPKPAAKTAARPAAGKRRASPAAKSSSSRKGAAPSRRKAA